MSQALNEIAKTAKDIEQHLFIRDEDHRKELLDYVEKEIAHHTSEHELVQSIVRKMERFIMAEPDDRLHLARSLAEWKHVEMQGDAVLKLLHTSRQQVRNHKL